MSTTIRNQDINIIYTYDKWRRPWELSALNNHHIARVREREKSNTDDSPVANYHYIGHLSPS